MKDTIESSWLILHTNIQYRRIYYQYQVQLTSNHQLLIRYLRIRRPHPPPYCSQSSINQNLSTSENDIIYLFLQR